MKFILAGWILILTLSCANAQQIGDSRCKNAAFTSASVGRIEKIVGSIIDAVEGVAPDEAAYIHSEVRMALQQSNKARFDAVAKRRSYDALKFHDAAKIVTDNLIAAKGARDHDLARYLVVVLSGMIDFQVTMEDYIRKHPSMLTNDNRDMMFFNMPTAKSQTTSLLQCVVSVL